MNKPYEDNGSYGEKDDGPKDDHQTVSKVWRWFERAMRAHDTWLRAAKRQEDFFAGEQWDEADKQRLGKRPALTINLIKPAVLTICGEQQSSRAETTFKPRNSLADSETASVLAQLSQYVDSDTRYEHVESQVFMDGCITDRGYVDIRMSFEDNINGDIKISADNSKYIVLDPDCSSYDPDQWPGVGETYWWSVDQIAAEYGEEKAKQVAACATMDLDYVSESLSLRWEDDRIARYEGGTLSAVSVDGVGVRYIQEVRIAEHQYFCVRKDAWALIDPVTGDVTDPRCDLEYEQLVPIAAQRGMKLVQMPRKRVKWCVVARNVVLHEGWSPYPFLTKAAFFPTFLRGRPLGIVGDMISPQEQLNKVESQELHVINTTANSGWIYEDGSIINMTDEEMEENGAETGLILKVRKGAGFEPKKILPNTVPTGLAHKAQKNVEYMRFISMVNDAMLGISSPEVSGVAMAAKKRSGITSYIPAFTNLEKTRDTIAKRKLWLIQNFYTAPRIIRITDYSVPERPEIEVGVNMPDAVGNILNNVTIGRYDVVTSSAPARDTQDESQFAQMIEMREAGIMLPDNEVIRRSNLTDKFPLSDMVAKMQGMGEPSPQEQAMQEFMMNAEIQRIQLDLARGEAEVMKLQSEAAINMAKAEQLRAEAATAGAGANDALIKAAVERERIAADLQKNQQNLQARLLEVQQTLDTKLRIAQMQVGVKQEGMLHTSAVKRAQESNKSAENGRRDRLASAQLAFKAALQQRHDDAKAQLERERIDAQKEAAKAAAKAKPKAGGKQPQKK